MTVDDLKIFKDIPTIMTERLKLRKIRKKDLNDVFEYSSDPDVSRFLLWMPHESKRITASYLSRVKDLYRKCRFYDWGIEYGGKMIGTCGFSGIDLLNDEAEMGYVLNRSFWGLGIATEAARAVIDFGFTVLGLLRIEAKYIAGNERSERIMQKCGMTSLGIKRGAMTVNGVLKDIGTYSISKEEYNKIHTPKSDRS